MRLAAVGCRTGTATFVILAGAMTACAPPQTMLAQLLDARRVASELHVQFTQAADASNRAVMADTDPVAAAAAAEARNARGVVERNVATLKSLLQSLGYREDLGALEGFAGRYDEYRRVDDEILPLAVENTNVKAQRLSFGPAQQAADAFRTALERTVMAGDDKRGWQSQALAARAVSAVRRVQVLQAPHIAEADLAAMSRMEREMAASEDDARSAVRQLAAVLPASNSGHLADAIAALDRFAVTNKDLIALSRRNSDVHSLALSLGRKRTVTAECEAQLRALDQTLESHQFTATR
jgi:hypothetical protein